MVPCSNRTSLLISQVQFRSPSLFLDSLSERDKIFPLQLPGSGKNPTRCLKHIDSGLLYYLRIDQTQGIAVQRSDLLGLIMRRNELANDILKASIIQQLPPMLQSPNTCRSCRHLNVCTIYH
uniref:Uncharacterized protein n=1 Tax=Nelumbo nucifera TaxID=4432 RepID=A0A822YDW4_NELNU|nr:TPA_asm: hypothetical protein HUJ06_030714 [Nelumbo nucifera]